MGLRSDSYWRIILILLFIVVCLMIAVIISALVPALLEKPGGKDTSDSCQSSAFRIDPTLPKIPSIFQDLTKEELISVRDYLLGSTSLNLTKYEDASLSSNFIFLIELYLPAKAAALGHLRGGHSKPMRRARAVIINGGTGRPSVEELIVYPLPKPNKHKKLELAGRRSPIPYTSRPLSILETKGHLKLVREATELSYGVLRASFDYWYHNCTTRCLFYLPIGSPGTVLPGKRRSWLTFLRRVPGQFLHTVPYELYVDHTEPNPSLWKIIGVMYANQYFSSIKELVDKYKQNKVRKVKISAPKEDEIERGWFARRGSSFMKQPLRPPIVFEPNGKRYTLKGRQIQYSGWEFDIGMRTSAGPSIFDIRFNGSSIAYELSIQEAASFYAGRGPKQSSAQYMDSQGRLGAATLELIKGVDCPASATFIDTDNFMDTGEVVTNRNSMCIFEMNLGIPSRRHIDMKMTKDASGMEGLRFTGGLVDYALVVRTISTPLNHDFIFDFIFHQNGVIEARTSMTGYLQTAFYNNKESEYGYLSYPFVGGTIHDNFVLYKVDLDVDGINNTFQSLDVVTKNISYPWERGTFRTTKEIRRNVRKTEQEGLLHFDFNKPNYYVVRNDMKRNRYKNPKGYRIQPQYMVKQLYSNDYFVTKAASWTKYQLAVSKYKDNERFGSCIYAQYGAAEPICSFDEYFNDNETIENTDIVTWVVVGGLRIPNTEDVPATVTTGNGFSLFLKPFGFFDSDPTMGSTDAVLITKNKGKLHVDTFGTPSKATCSLRDRKFTYGG